MSSGHLKLTAKTEFFPLISKCSSLQFSPSPKMLAAPSKYTLNLTTSHFLVLKFQISLNPFAVAQKILASDVQLQHLPQGNWWIRVLILPPKFRALKFTTRKNTIKYSIIIYICYLRIRDKFCGEVTPWTVFILYFHTEKQSNLLLPQGVCLCKTKWTWQQAARFFFLNGKWVNTYVLLSNIFQPQGSSLIVSFSCSINCDCPDIKYGWICQGAYQPLLELPSTIEIG